MKDDVWCICGSRFGFDNERLRAYLDRVLEGRGPPGKIVVGGSRGVDAQAAKWAKDAGIPVLVYAANWKRYGRAAGPIRNADMAEVANVVIAFPGGRGTSSMVGEARKANLHVILIEDAP